jgi:hypothetical protein
MRQEKKLVGSMSRYGDSKPEDCITTERFEMFNGLRYRIETAFDVTKNEVAAITTHGPRLTPQLEANT